jgi:hypothetical protein
MLTEQLGNANQTTGLRWLNNRLTLLNNQLVLTE